MQFFEDIHQRGYFKCQNCGLEIIETYPDKIKFKDCSSVKINVKSKNWIDF